MLPDCNDNIFTFFFCEFAHSSLIKAKWSAKFQIVTGGVYLPLYRCFTNWNLTFLDPIRYPFELIMNWMTNAARSVKEDNAGNCSSIGWIYSWIRREQSRWSILGFTYNWISRRILWEWPRHAKKWYWMVSLLVLQLQFSSAP